MSEQLHSHVLLPERFQQSFFFFLRRPFTIYRSIDHSYCTPITGHQERIDFALQELRGLGTRAMQSLSRAFHVLTGHAINHFTRLRIISSMEVAALFLERRRSHSWSPQVYRAYLSDILCHIRSLRVVRRWETDFNDLSSGCPDALEKSNLICGTYILAQEEA
jgi:hypothetical protein